MDPSIDSFVNIPILVTCAAGLILFILLLLSKIRNTSKVSFIFYIVIGISLAGLVYTYLNQKLAYLVFTVLISELLLIIYAFVLAVSDPKKKKEKKHEEKDAASGENAIDEEALKALKQEYEEKSWYPEGFPVV